MSRKYEPKQHTENKTAGMGSMHISSSKRKKETKRNTKLIHLDGFIKSIKADVATFEYSSIEMRAVAAATSRWL